MSEHLYSLYCANRKAAVLALATRVRLFDFIDGVVDNGEQKRERRDGQQERDANGDSSERSAGHRGTGNGVSLHDICQHFAWSARGAAAVVTALTALKVVQRVRRAHDYNSANASHADRPSSPLPSSQLYADTVHAAHVRYTLTDDTRRHLVTTSPDYFGALIDLEYDEFITPAMLHRAVRAGRPQVYGGARDAWRMHECDAQRCQAFTRAMHSISSAPARYLARYLVARNRGGNRRTRAGTAGTSDGSGTGNNTDGDDGGGSDCSDGKGDDDDRGDVDEICRAARKRARRGTSPTLSPLPMHVLDVGGGSGCVALEIATRAPPYSTVTIMEIPACCAVAREYVNAAAAAVPSCSQYNNDDDNDDDSATSGVTVAPSVRARVLEADMFNAASYAPWVTARSRSHSSTSASKLSLSGNHHRGVNVAAKDDNGSGSVSRAGNNDPENGAPVTALPHYTHVVFSQILHDWPAHHCNTLLRNACDALTPHGGTLVVHEKLIEEEDDRDDDDEENNEDNDRANSDSDRHANDQRYRNAATAPASMAARTADTAMVTLDMLCWTDGQQFTRRQLTQLLRRNGFVSVRVRKSQHTYWHFITATPAQQ